MPQMPTLGPPPKNKSGMVAVIAVVMGLIGGGGYWLLKGRPPAEPVPDAPASAASNPGLSAVDAGTKLSAAPLPPSREELRAAAGLKLARMEINGALETAFVEAAGSAVGPALAQVVTRTLVWWVEVPNEVLRGDKLDVLFEERAGQEPVVHAVRFVSGKNLKTHEAYRFTAEGDAFARHYEPSGEELERRLSASPIEDYEQVTSLIRDGRRHKGVDFKAPVGTPVKATFNGTITRKNWNFRGNGNSLEIAEGGKKALYLHLNELPAGLSVGQRVKTGQVLAQSGNTGRSFAPHLHFQLMGPSDKVLDPFAAATYRRKLKGTDEGRFLAERTRLSGLLGDGAESTAAAGK